MLARLASHMFSNVFTGAPEITFGSGELIAYTRGLLNAKIVADESVETGRPNFVFSRFDPTERLCKDDLGIASVAVQVHTVTDYMP